MLCSDIVELEELVGSDDEIGEPGDVYRCLPREVCIIIARTHRVSFKQNVRNRL